MWLFNLLFYYLIEQRKVFLIVEEPESHLYPASQQTNLPCARFDAYQREHRHP